MKNRFLNKVALITGATSGIGKATALAFAAEGAKVVIVGQDSIAGNDIVRQIMTQHGQAFFIKTDVRQESEIVNMIELTIKKYGDLDFAFNNAGVSSTGLLSEENENNYHLVMDTNVKGTFLCMKHQIQHMLQKKKGVIINASSAVAQGFTVPTHGLYNASKNAILSLTETAAAEVTHQGIRVNAICPIGIIGKLVDRYLHETGKSPLDIAPPTGRLGTPQDVANLVLFLCSEEASYFSGSKITMDGGMLVKRF